MVLYLQGYSRPAISFAGNKSSRYVFSPKKSHEEALKIIGRYLKGTRDKGLIIKPTKMLQIDCFVDVDFSRRWNHEDIHEPTSAKSRS